MPDYPKVKGQKDKGYCDIITKVSKSLAIVQLRGIPNVEVPCLIITFFSVYELAYSRLAAVVTCLSSNKEWLALIELQCPINLSFCSVKATTMTTGNCNKHLWL